MPTTRIREKISALVSSQLPEFIQSDFPTFVSFIEAYYQFLEQDQGALEIVQNARSYNDIDSTTEDFVKYFLKNYTLFFPEDSLIDKRFLVKKISDIYTAKGSSISFDVLFRVLYNTSVEIKTPFDFVLRASDGRWDQRVSLRLRTISGNRTELQNRFITHQKNNIVYTTPVLSIKNLSSSLTEVFLDKNFLSPTYSVGDTVTVINGSNQIVFTGVIEPTTTSYSILRAGSGFKVGQVYTLSYGGAVDSIIKITKVSSVGAIQEIKFLVYGYGFDVNDDPLLLDLDPTKNFSEIVDVFADSTGGFSTELTITDLFQDYFLQDYVTSGYLKGNTLATAFTTSAFTPGLAASKPPQIASISFRFGALGVYPGQFTAENGFLSEPDVRLQDSLLYQPFAYQTNTDIDREEFFDVVKKLIHPAGQNLFNNRILEANIDLAGNVSLAFISNIFFEATDSFSVGDLQALTIQKPEFDSVSAVVVDVDLDVFKPLNEIVEIVENQTYLMQINITDSDILVDNPLSPDRYFDSDYAQQLYTFNEVLANQPEAVFMSDQITVGYFVTREFTEQRSNDYFLELYAEDYAQVTGFLITDTALLNVQSSYFDTTSISEEVSIEVQKDLVNGITESEAVISSLIPQISSNVSYLDSQTLQDDVSIQLLTTINNQTIVSDTTTGFLLDYVDTTYFANAYAGTPVI